MTNKKVIDMSKVVGTDTLCELANDDGNLFKLDDATSIVINEHGETYHLQIAEGIWQSTANNLVIPDGLVCDLTKIGSSGETHIATGILSEHIDLSYVEVVAVKVTGVREDYRYAWEAEDV